MFCKMEQLLQKEEKRTQSIKFIVTDDYSGAIFPLKHGLKTFFCVPWTEDPRLAIYANETIRVTRWQKRWLYGELEEKNKTCLDRRNRLLTQLT